MPKISPFLWFDDKAEEAAEFYVKVFTELERSHRRDVKITASLATRRGCRPAPGPP